MRKKVAPGQLTLLNSGYRFRFYKGQKFALQHRLAIAEGAAKPYKFESPEGEIFEGKNIRAFAIAHGLSVEMMQHIAAGRCHCHKGWSRPGQKIDPRLKTVELMSPDGEIVTVCGVATFARAIGVAPGHLINVANGIRPQCKGWKLAPCSNSKL